MNDVPDILSYPKRKNIIHIISLDRILAADIYKRIDNHPKLQNYRLVLPKNNQPKEIIAEIDAMAPETVSSKLLIIDVRKDTLPWLRNQYNKIVGYNRKDFNNSCYTILIGDGPLSLFQAGKSLDVFVPHLSAHRIDYHPAVFFYDPFLHYEPDEITPAAVDNQPYLPTKIPKRLVPYFKEKNDITVKHIRRFFRATGKPEEIKKQRLQILIDLFQKRIEQQFPHHKDKSQIWLSKEGISLATEKMHLYPLFFEDWVYDLTQKATLK
ncbi:MAG: hypothetical protein ACYS18_11680 [Planctomycetota bacterium]|jgi:hypothetical protein